jgi:Lectin C-type domain
MKQSHPEPMSLVGTARCAFRFFSLSPIGGEGWGEGAAYDFSKLRFMGRAAFVTILSIHRSIQNTLITFRKSINCAKLLRPLPCVAFLAALAGAPLARAEEWVQWSSAVGGNDHFYSLTPSPTNWTGAEKIAVSWGGTLATITSSKEQDFINNTFLTGAFEHQPVWIGLSDPATPGTLAGAVRELKKRLGQNPKGRFVWITGEPLNYTNWKPGEPNNSPPGEYYVAINWEYSDSPPRGAKGDWNDTPLNGTTSYGGATSGPYFGLMERDTDPSLPPKRQLAASAMGLSLIALLLLALAIYFLRSRRKTEFLQPVDHQYNILGLCT